MRDFILGLCILGSFAMGAYFVSAHAEQWLHWPIYFSMLCLLVLALTPIRGREEDQQKQTSLALRVLPKWIENIPEPIRKSISIFLALLVGGLLAALAAKLGLPMPSPGHDK
jgi:ABC-type branched-subunit amino acid transport system permease subunit